QFPSRLVLKSGNSTSGPIIYEGVAATYNSATGAVTDAGTVITDTNSTDHFAFGIGSSTDHSQQSYITIQNLTFDDCGVASLDAPVDHLHITGNLVRNDVTHSGNTPEWNGGGAIYANHGLTNSTIDYNVFKDNQIAFGIYFPYEGQTPLPVYNSFHVDHNTFS